MKENVWKWSRIYCDRCFQGYGERGNTLVNSGREGERVKVMVEARGEEEKRESW